MPEPIKILFLSSNPKNISRIRLDEELREVDERIQLGKFRDRFELIPQFAVRPRDIGRALMRYQPHVLHFSGHGSPTEGIVLEDDEGKTKLVSAEALAKLLAVIKDNLRVVVLNACYSRLQADGIIKAIDCAIGMQQKIGDHSAIAFSAAFYEALAQGRSVEEAFKVGVANLAMEGIPEETTPSLLIKQGVEAAKIYLATREQPSTELDPVPEPANGGQAVSISIPGQLNTGGTVNITGIGNIKQTEFKRN
jgi:CHAT domain